MRGHSDRKYDKTKKKAALEAKARELFEANKKVMVRVGLSDAVKKAGIEAGRYKVRHLIARLGLEVRYPKRYRVTTDRDHNAAIHRINWIVNLLWQSLITDITYVWTLEGWFYVTIVIALFSRQVVGWAMANHMRTAFCVSALQMAFWRRKTRAWTAASLRSRQSICQSEIPETPGYHEDGTEYEPERQLLG